jgi:ribonuclease BN (tRNA processing enzyme)
MIKFAEAFNENVVPKITEQQRQFDSLKSTIYGMIDKTLIVNNLLQIEGKEMLVESILDLLSQKDNNKTISYLESLKITNRDWNSIDEKISQVNKDSDNIRFLSEHSSHVSKIKDFLQKYARSEDFDDLLEKQIMKIDRYESAAIRSKVASLMLEDNIHNYPKNRLRSIANKYNYRANVLNSSND